MTGPSPTSRPGRRRRGIDVSATDPAWRCHCGERHRPGSPCPRPGIWLVASICLRCHPSPAGTFYCSRHDLHDKFQHLTAADDEIDDREPWPDQPAEGAA